MVGHHVEVPAASAQSLGPGFTLRQGLASSTRFTTPELDGLAAALEEASAQARRAEKAVFVELSAAAVASREVLTRIAHAAAALDLVAGLAQAAAEGFWVEPELAGDTGLDIEGGRHPVAEALLEAEGRAFVANDCRMGEAERIWLLTGPNMAGKSTLSVTVNCKQETVFSRLPVTVVDARPGLTRAGEHQPPSCFTERLLRPAAGRS